jgi:5-methylcytosine-specific restriction enzyme B
MNKDTINEIVKKFQPVIDSEEFYFQKGQDALNEWLNLEIPLDLQDRITTISDKYEKLQLEAEKDPAIKNILDLLFQIISYCDVKAKDKIKYNKYPDKRTLAEAAVRMNHWIEKLIQYKFFRSDVPSGSIRHAFDYLLDPENQSTILSKKHRELISKNLLNRDPESTTFVSDLKQYFSAFNLKVKNPANYTYLLSGIIYNIEDEWKEEVVGLMASDGTGWQDGFIDELKEFDAAIVWNSKRPSGKGKTLEVLREIVDDGKTFNLYYCSAGLVKYKATIIDFVDSQELLEKCNWPERFKKIMNYEDKFENYQDDTKKANIVFLTQAIERLSPIPVSDFKFYNGYEAPRQDNLSPIKYEPTHQSVGDETKSLGVMASTNKIKPQLNQILYGPPGTGKTFNSINHAVAIVENKSVDEIDLEERSDIKNRFDNYLKEGRIVFTTFHQSLSYEDFIEGIKPETVEEEVTYEVKDGIFKKLCLEAAFSIARERKSAETTKALDFANLYDQFVDSVEVTLSTPGTSVEVPTKSGGKIQIAGISPQGNILAKHIDGSRTYTISKQRLTVLDQNIENLDEISNVNTTFREIIGGSNSSAYFAILKVIRSLQPKTGVSDRVYSMDDKIAAVRALTIDDYKKATGIPYVIIMDEINRGNISQIFGELITLIEDDKRLGRGEALEVTLPYSKEKFGVPPNIHLIGTMNTADRSVEALDTALRRRFSFKEIPPASKLITTQGKLKANQGKVEGIDLAILLDTINNRVEKLLDKDHLIGHSYFMNIEKLSDLKHAFQNKINPLLQEYFYGDFGKIGLVIGKSFFTEESLMMNDDGEFFAEFPEYETSELLERRPYQLKNVTEMNDQEFINSLNKLLRK